MCDCSKEKISAGLLLSLRVHTEHVWELSLQTRVQDLAETVLQFWSLHLYTRSLRPATDLQACTACGGVCTYALPWKFQSSDETHAPKRSQPSETQATARRNTSHSSQPTRPKGRCCPEPTGRPGAHPGRASAGAERVPEEWPGRVQRRELLWQPRLVLALPLGLASDDDSFASFELSDGARGLISAGSRARQSALCLHRKNLWELGCWLQGRQDQVPWSGSLYNQLEKQFVVSFKSH